MVSETRFISNLLSSPSAEFVEGGWEPDPPGFRTEPSEAAMEQIEAALAPLRSGLPRLLFMDPLVDGLSVKFFQRRTGRWGPEARTGVPA